MKNTVWSVYESALPEKLTAMAAYLAECGDQEGKNIHPGVPEISAKLKVSRTTVFKRMRELQTMGILVPMEAQGGGRGKFVIFQMIVAKLPQLKEVSRPVNRPDFKKINRPDLNVNRPDFGLNRPDFDGPIRKDSRCKDYINHAPVSREVTVFNPKGQSQTRSQEPSGWDGPRNENYDPRFQIFKKKLERFWSCYHPDIARKWTASDGHQLGLFLEKFPDLTGKKFHDVLVNFANSDDVNLDQEPRELLPILHRYITGPLGKYGKPWQAAG